jgi:nicotinamide phosphoribosyltransferase
MKTEDNVIETSYTKQAVSVATLDAAKAQADQFIADSIRRAKLWADLKLLGDPRTIEKPEDNVILDVDSYKLCHQAMYGRLGVTGAFSYIEPRSFAEKVLFFGLQIWIKRLRPITMEMIDQAEAFFEKHIIGGKEIFPRADWEKVVNVYGGHLPLRIRALPEGMVIDSRNALVTIESTDPELAWMVAYFETSMLRAVWYPTTVASRSMTVRNILKKYISETSDLSIAEAIAFMFHDFGARGVSSIVSAGIGGAAHLATGAMGTDTITGALFANTYYNSEMSAYSVFATEHSIMTMRGRDGELKTVNDIIDEFGRFGVGTLISIVSDGYDIFNLAREFAKGDLRQKILDKGIKLVVRPDSGDAVTVILELLKIFEEGFGVTVNSKGYKVLNVVRILQGDGLSKPEDFERICMAVKSAGFSIENMVFGQGGGLLQQVNRDTYKFAEKTCAAEVDGVWVDVFKDPITDSGKRSKAGRLTVVQSKVGEYMTIRIEDMTEDHTEVMQDVWYNGQILKEYDLEEVRARANQ